MNEPTVSISGPPGSGKSTAGRLAAELLGLEYVSAGDIFRAEAKARGLDLEAFSRYAESHDEVDRRLDERMIELAKSGRLLDGRITGTLLRRRGLPVVTVEVVAEAAVRHARIAGREKIPLDRARGDAEVRERSEAKRYLHLYGIDLAREKADLTVDSTQLRPEAVAERIVDFVRPHRLSGGAR
ncbi:MAG: AAA family ATPase [Thermoplasmata archaeon]|nr:AAA family ATPase [Thermoplasmata archaeon]